MLSPDIHCMTTKSCKNTWTPDPGAMNYTILVAISLLFIIICLVFFFLNYTNLYPIFITPRVGVMNFTINDPTHLEMLYTE